MWFELFVRSNGVGETMIIVIAVDIVVITIEKILQIKMHEGGIAQFNTIECRKITRYERENVNPASDDILGRQATEHVDTFWKCDIFGASQAIKMRVLIKVVTCKKLWQIFSQLDTCW